MSSSPTNGATKCKINLSVASLLSGANVDRLSANEKQGKTSMCAVKSESFYKDVSTCASTIPRNLPTVANSELLYKTISSRSVSPSQMPPLAPTRPQVVMTRPPVGLVRPIPTSVNYTVQQIFEQHGYSGYSSVSKPMTNMKTATYSLAAPTMQSQSSHFQVKTTTNVQQTPAPSITLSQGHHASIPESSIVYSRLSSSPVSCTTFADSISSGTHVMNGDMMISNVGSDHSSGYKCEVVSEGNVGSMNMQDCTSYGSEEMSMITNSANNEVTYTPNLTAMSKHYGEGGMLSGGLKNVQNVAIVPKGWNRIIEKGVIIYISPNKSRIRSYDDMIEYLETENTCKCGLECPVRPRELFNFDPKVSSKLSYTDSEACQREFYCDTCKEFDNLMSTSLSQKRCRGRGRRRGRTKSTNEEEEKPGSDRKKILLTGASPLEMFQSGMQAINALSDSQFQNYSMGLDESKQTASLLNKFTTGPLTSSTSKRTNISIDDKSTQNVQKLSNTLPGGAQTDISTDNCLQNVHPSCVSPDTLLQNVCASDCSNNENYESNQLSNLISSSNTMTSFKSSDNFCSASSSYVQSVMSVTDVIKTCQSGASVHTQSVPSPKSISSYESNSRSFSTSTSYHAPSSSHDISHSELNNIAADIIKTESVDMPFPSSLMGNKKRVRKTNTKGRPRTKLPESYTVDVPCEPIIKQYIKKVLPDADIKKASELQPNEFTKHSSYLIKQGTMQQSLSEISSLKTIHSDVEVASRPQLVSTTSLSNESRNTSELQDLYKSLQVSVVGPQSTSTYNKMSNLPSSYSSKTDLSPSYDSPPPNRTVNSTDQLPEALVNQLGYKYSTSNGYSLDKNTMSTSNLKTDAIAMANIPGRSGAHQSMNTKVPIVSAIQEKVLPVSVAMTSASATSIAICDGNNQPLNRPLQNVNISHNILSSTSQSTQHDNGQQMLLLQFVTQNADQNDSTVTKVNAPIVRAYSMSHPQAYVQQCQSKYVLMGKNNASQTLATLAMQSKANALNTPPVDATKRTLQIQGLIPVQTNASQLSPRGVAVSHAVPVQYVTTVNPGLPIGNQNVEQSYPVMQYIPPTRPAHVSYVYPGTNTTVIRPTISSITNNYVRIAPAMQPIATTVNLYDIEKKKKEQELLESLQEQLLVKQSNISQDKVCVTPAFHTSAALASSNIPHSESPSVSSVNLSATTSMNINDQGSNSNSRIALTSNTESTIYNNNNINNNNTLHANVNICSTNTSLNLPSVPSPTMTRSYTGKVQTVSALSPVITTCIPSAVICSPHSSTVVLLPGSYQSSQNTMVKFSSNPSTTSAYSGNKDRITKVDINEEITLHCNEKAADLLLNHEDSNMYCTSQDMDGNSNISDGSLLYSHNISAHTLPRPEGDSQFKVGELVWVKITGYPSWPGRVVSYLEAKKPKLNDGRIYVSWFGSNQINAVDLNQLKSFDEGFKGLDGNLTKRGYRANKKQLNELEKAIAAALEHSERNKGQLPVSLNPDVNNI